ncbi:MAG: hypothetical protein PHD01_15220 [Geobacteraceae bacterium]|nr:hypothetical protein [Geobacteraceae bacterium]
MKIFLLFVSMLTVTGCSASAAYKPFPLEVANPMSMGECRPVANYPGPYGYRFWGPPPVLGDFKYQSALKARDAGATHIFFREADIGYYGATRVFGYAFDCTGVTMPKNYEDPDLY